MPTSLDIANAAGVSQATVSRALRNSPLVRIETRERIHKIARELNYTVNRNAASLRTHQSRTIALLLFDEAKIGDSQINPFFLSMLGNITQAAANLDYDVLVSFQQLSDDWHIRYEASNRADGIILLGYGKDYVSYREKLAALAKANARFIIWGPIVKDQPGHSLGCDNVRGAFQATTHLIKLGRRRIAYLGGASEHCPELMLRQHGYADALRRSNLHPAPELQVDAGNQESSGYQAAMKLLKSGISVDGVIAATDLIAFGAIHAFQEIGMSVPEDVSVVGFDDLPAASYSSPPLTTVQQDTRLAGELLVGNLVKLIDEEEVDSVLLQPKLIVRDSCGGRSA